MLAALELSPKQLKLVIQPNVRLMLGVFPNMELVLLVAVRELRLDE